MKTGRPPKEPQDVKHLVVRIRVTQSERDLITRRAKKAKARTDTAWIRQRLLGDE